MFNRLIFETVLRRMREPRRFIQVLAGPRQVGKTTLARQCMEKLDVPVHYVSADEPTLRDRTWVEQQWERARLQARGGEALLILDEVQKVAQWSEVVKRLWDEDGTRGIGLKVVLLGSAPLLVQKGLTESLAGRFEIIHVPHWSFQEMHEAFGWDLDAFIYFGGYPGAAGLIQDEMRWKRYILDSLIETTISRDVLLLTQVNKPALLRQLFQLGCEYSGQVVAYQKMLGQLQDAGNTTTLAHYLGLLEGAGLLAGLQKFSERKIRQRASSPKLQVLNNALMTSLSGFSFEEAQQNRNIWGRLTESAIGAHLLNYSRGTDLEVFYWRDRNFEVDFVLRMGSKIVPIEVKSGRKVSSHSGTAQFSKRTSVRRQLLVGSGGIPLEEFLLVPPGDWLQ